MPAAPTQPSAADSDSATSATSVLSAPLDPSVPSIHAPASNSPSAPDPSAAPLLQLTDVSLVFGGLTAVQQVHLALAPGELCGLIGPNGAGKTSLFNLITGVYRPTRGRLTFAGHDLTTRAPQQIAALGIARTFQNIRLFPSLSVFDHVRVAGNLHRTTHPAAACWRGPAFCRDEASQAHRAEALLEMFNLRACRDEPATRLSYGDQRRLEIVRALATRPRLLLLDEPAAGMNPSEKAELVRLLQTIHREFALTVLLVEHSMRVIMTLCPRIVVLDRGACIADAPPDHVRADPAVLTAYLGGGATRVETGATSTASPPLVPTVPCVLSVPFSGTPPATTAACSPTPPAAPLAAVRTVPTPPTPPPSC